MRASVTDMIDLIQTQMAIQFNRDHKVLEFSGEVYIRLTWKDGKGYHLPSSSKLSLILIGPFKIKQKVSKLAYKLNLPPSLQLHPVISVIHLKQCITDNWKCVLPEHPELVLVHGEDEYEVKKILKQSSNCCLVQWCGLDKETWEPVANLWEDVPELLQKFQAMEQQKQVRKKTEDGAGEE